MQKHVNLVDLVKSFPTNIYLQNLASIQKRTSPVKFAHLAEKSGKGSISNLSTKARMAYGEKGAPAKPYRPEKLDNLHKAVRDVHENVASVLDKAFLGESPEGYAGQYIVVAK